MGVALVRSRTMSLRNVVITRGRAIYEHYYKRLH